MLIELDPIHDTINFSLQSQSFNKSTCMMKHDHLVKFVLEIINLEIFSFKLMHTRVGISCKKKSFNVNISLK